MALLHPLAHAYGDGLTIEPGTAWVETANRLRHPGVAELTREDVLDVASRARDYLLTESDSGAQRLFHEGVGGAIRTVVAQDAMAETGEAPDDAAALEAKRRVEARRFTDALVELLPAADAPAKEYDAVDPYLLRYLPTHLSEQRRTADVLDRPGLLLAADQDGLARALVRGAANVPATHEPARVAAVYALARPHHSRVARAAAYCAALRRQGLNTLAARVREAIAPSTSPYELVNGPPLPPMLATIADAHTGSITAVAVLEDREGPLVVTAGNDRTVVAIPT